MPSTLEMTEIELASGETLKPEYWSRVPTSIVGLPPWQPTAHAKTEAIPQAKLRNTYGQRYGEGHALVPHRFGQWPACRQKFAIFAKIARMRPTQLPLHRGFSENPAEILEVTIVRVVDSKATRARDAASAIGSQEQSRDLDVGGPVFVPQLGGFIDFWLDVRGSLCFSFGLLLEGGDRYRANVQAAEGIMQERANTTNGEIPEISAVDSKRGKNQSAVAHADEANPATMRSPVSSADRSTSQTRVLICDDETRLVTLTAGLLRELGYDVLAVKSGEEAIDCVRRVSVDVVILDVNLPGEDTLSVARQLIQNNAPAIVLSSGFTEEDVESDLLSLPGVRAFLAKPYGIEALSATIRSVVGASGPGE